jgi:hypothetical protein
MRKSTIYDITPTTHKSPSLKAALRGRATTLSWPGIGRFAIFRANAEKVAAAFLGSARQLPQHPNAAVVGQFPPPRRATLGLNLPGRRGASKCLGRSLSCATQHCSQQRWKPPCTPCSSETHWQFHSRPSQLPSDILGLTRSLHTLPSTPPTPPSRPSRQDGHECEIGDVGLEGIPSEIEPCTLVPTIRLLTR